ncbi:MAG: hypothetical protein FVQ82_11795 [Planctomycetes bacterium]|nr:hypothetical protein [Planctomycetota bacterium]
MGQVNKSGIKKLSKRQLDVIDDLFKGSCNETKVMKKHKVSRGVYRKWLGDENFVDELAFRVESAKRQSEMIMAKHAPKAADKLVTLTDSEKEETARKACLDVMTHPMTLNSSKAESKNVPDNISTETAGRLLRALAKDECGKV